MPKPAMPCSVKGVLNTRSRPNSSASPCSGIIDTSDQIRAQHIHHCTPKYTSEGNVLSEDDSRIIFHHGNADEHHNEHMF
jgi:hypothetical protein